MKHPANSLSLVADIGGTNTRCALADGPTVLPDSIRRYSNADYADLKTVLKQYLTDEGDVDPIAACVAVAGPVRDGCAKMTNLDWQIDEQTLAEATQAETVAILNDLQAQGHALGHLASDAVRPVLAGPAETASAQETKLVVGVGTGFNAAPVFETAGGRVVAASECGHAGLPVAGPLEQALADFVAKAHGFAAIEDVLSGRGLERVYAFLANQDGVQAQATAQAIVAGAASGEDARAVRAIKLFVKVLGEVCGNLALIQLPFGGVYLVGGVARAVAPYLSGPEFEGGFYSKGRFSDFMTGFSVSVIEDDYAALTGAATHVSTMVRDLP